MNLKPGRSLTILILLSTQMLSLMSMVLWVTLFFLLTKAGNNYSLADITFLFYPVLPVSLSVFAWIAFRLRRYVLSVIASGIPALIALALMTYYYIIGTSHY